VREKEFEADPDPEFWEDMTIWDSASLINLLI
jgi:hypothetical protein